MKVIKIEESKMDKLSEYAEKILKHGGKLMQCIEELSEGGYGERDDEDDFEDDEEMGMREGYRGGSRYGNRYGNRDEMGMRRSSRTGRYMR
jgi:hypothetical protein